MRFSISETEMMLSAGDILFDIVQTIGTKSGRYEFGKPLTFEDFLGKTSLTSDAANLGDRRFIPGSDSYRRLEVSIIYRAPLKLLVNTLFYSTDTTSVLILT